MESKCPNAYNRSNYQSREQELTITRLAERDGVLN